MPISFDDLVKVSPTRGRARSAFFCYCMISQTGFDAARNHYPRSTWYKHLSILKKAGCTEESLRRLYPDLIELRSKLPEGIVLLRS